MSEPVFIRGDCGEADIVGRNRHGYVILARASDQQGVIYGLDRRTSPSIAARFDECIAAAREPLMRLIEEQAAQIARLESENRRMRSVIDTAANTIQRRMVADALLHRHAASGEVAND